MNHYDRYKEQALNSMTKGEILVLLFEEAIKSLKRAGLSLQKTDYDKFNVHISKAFAIVKELDGSIDYHYEIGKELHRMYDFIQVSLSKISASRKIEQINEIIPLLEDLHDSFKQADVITKQ